MTAVDAILSIPAVFWGVVVGSFFSILGVYLTNIFTIKKSRETFKSNLKRDTFSQCIEGAFAATSVIGSLVDLNTEDYDINNEYKLSMRKM